MDKFFDNLDAKMTASKYFELCEQMNIEPKEDEIPPEFSDFPDIVQISINIYNMLGDRVQPDIGFLGKDYTNLKLIFEFNGIEEDRDKELSFEVLAWLDKRNIKRSSDQLKRERDKIKNKSANKSKK